jgi:hypothetical protein
MSATLSFIDERQALTVI